MIGVPAMWVLGQLAVLVPARRAARYRPPWQPDRVGFQPAARRRIQEGYVMTCARGSCHRRVVTAHPNAAPLRPSTERAAHVHRVCPPYWSSTTTRPCAPRSKCCCRCRGCAWWSAGAGRRLRAAGASGRRPRDPGHELPPRGDLGRGRRRALSPRSASAHPDLPIMLLTAWTHLETAVELVKAGAADYLAKPWDDTRLLTTVRNLLRAALGDPRASSARRAAPRGRARR